MNKEEIESQIVDETIFLEPKELFDKAIIGTKNNRLIYGYDEMIEAYMDYHQCSYGDAVEWIDYNTCRAIPYMGKFKPIVQHISEEEDSETETED